VAKIAEHMNRSPHPVVYCGDMNDVPMSYGYTMLREQLDDAFVENGRGTGGTYIGKLPSFRIDHILHSEALESWNFTTHPEELSDHHAISCLLAPRR
jgi:endonuclease/exonuclease/phosphatase family metal-dependent hydrolase